MRLRPGAATCAAAIAVASGPDYRGRIAGDSGPTAFAVVCRRAVAAGPAAAYSRPVDSYSRPVDSPLGSSAGFTGKSWDWCRRMAARHRALAVLTGTVALFGCGMLTAATSHPPVRLTSADFAIAAVTYAAFAAIAVARWPSWLLVAAGTAGAVVSMAAGTHQNLIGSELLMAMLVFSLASDLPRVTVGGVAAAAALGLGHLLFSRHAATGLADLEVVPALVVVAAIGQAVRARRIQRTLVAERARHAEELHEHDARQRIRERVHEERLRIARELHDAVGHQVALISVQSGAMSYLLGADPASTDLAKARESLGHIQRASEAALEELRLTVGLLRQPGERESTEPAAGLARLEELIDSFAATGLQVTCEVIGQAQPLSEAVDLTAYRLIQESLTNTTKHAAGACASVRLTYRPGVLALAVEDDGPHARDDDDGPPTPRDDGVAGHRGAGHNRVHHGGAYPGGAAGHAGAGNGEVGHGLIGMRERAAVVGGWVSAGPHDGGFLVLAELPLRIGMAA
jgi:signal transduction histidine kinase